MIAWLVARELRAQCVSPTFWVLLAVVQGLLAWLLFAQLDAYQQIAPRLIAAQSTLGVNDLVIAPTLNSLALLILLCAPLLGMHSLAEERQSGHLAILLSAPLATSKLVLGKWLGNTLAAGLLLASAALIPLSLYPATEVDGQRLAINLLALALLAGAASAIAVMFSAFSRHAAAVFAATFGLLLMLWLLDSLIPTNGAGYWLALNPHLRHAASGTLGRLDLAYFGLLTLAPLLIAGVSLARQRAARQASPFSMALFILLTLASVLLAGSLVQRHDQPVWQAQSAKLPESLQQTLQALQGPLVITAFAPELPLLRQRIEQLITPLRHHYSELELRFVDPRKQPQLAQAQQIQQDGELVIEAMGRRQQVRTLNYPSLTQALQRLARQGSPWIVALHGHGEARISDTSPAGLSGLAGALEQQGYQLLELNPSQASTLPQNAALVLLAAPRNEYPQALLTQLQGYLAEGGAVLWLHEGQARRTLEQISHITSLPGQVYDPRARAMGLSSPRQILISDLPAKLFPQPPGQSVLMLGAVALHQQAPHASSWSGIAQLRSGDQTWNETDAVTADEPTARRNPLAGEQSGPLTLGIAQQQGPSRLLVLGDSDVLRNALLGVAGNRAFGLGLINWLTDNRLGTAPAADDLQLHWSQHQAGQMAALHTFGLPLLYLLLGATIRWYRARA